MSRQSSRTGATSRTGNARWVLPVLLMVALLPVLVIVRDVWREPAAGRGSATGADPAVQVAKGEYLVRAGNCMACHTTRGGAPYAGGRAIGTPFGSIYASNITPDKSTGLGAWSADDFWRALHLGKSRDGRFLYPAFPYTSYTRVTRADADAMYAYLRTVTPVRQANREPELAFPFSQRILLPLWRSLYFKPGEFVADPGRGAQWNRGAYLVAGLGHCAACHTTRNALGGSSADADLKGGLMPMLDWYAAPLVGPAASGLDDWTVDDISDLLKTGVSNKGAVFGPMAEVVAGSLQHLSDGDVQAMAAYLKSQQEAGAVTAAPVKVPANAEAVLARGQRLYENLCIDCHGAGGKGAGKAYPPLADNRSMANGPPVNAIRIVLNGGFAPSTGGNPRPYGMPPFGADLGDEDVAALVSYIRRSWGNAGSFVSPHEVSRLRGVPVE